jgi:hypothetical protein
MLASEEVMPKWLKRLTGRGGKARPEPGEIKPKAPETLLRFDWDRDGWVQNLIRTKYPLLYTHREMLVSMIVKSLDQHRRIQAVRDKKKAREEGREE